MKLIISDTKDLINKFDHVNQKDITGKMTSSSCDKLRKWRFSEAKEERKIHGVRGPYMHRAECIVFGSCLEAEFCMLTAKRLYNLKLIFVFRLELQYSYWVLFFYGDISRGPARFDHPNGVWIRRKASLEGFDVAWCGGSYLSGIVSAGCWDFANWGCWGSWLFIPKA